MQIELYSPADADGIRSMLADHVDYAPEQVTDDASEDDLAFFEDAFVHENNGLIAYTLKDEGIVKGFMTLSRQFFSIEAGAWYITALFVRRDDQADQCALAMTELFQRLLSEPADICVAVHHAATQIIRFWNQNDFVFCPDRTKLTNADGEQLIVCRRKSGI